MTPTLGRLTGRGDRRTIRTAYVLLGHARRLPGKFDRSLGGRSILQREAATIRRAGLVPVLVSVAPRTPSGPAILPDTWDRGPLGGLATVVAATDRPFLLLAGDLPFLDAPLLRRLIRAYRGRCVVPRTPDRRAEPLCAIYAGLRPSDLSDLLVRGAGLRRLVEELDVAGRVQWVELSMTEARSLEDVDTPADLRRAVARAARRRPRRPINRVDGSPRANGRSRGRR